MTIIATKIQAQNDKPYQINTIHIDRYLLMVQLSFIVLSMISKDNYSNFKTSSSSSKFKTISMYYSTLDNTLQSEMRRNIELSSRVRYNLLACLVSASKELENSNFEKVKIVFATNVLNISEDEWEKAKKESDQKEEEELSREIAETQRRGLDELLDKIYSNSCPKEQAGEALLGWMTKVQKKGEIMIDRTVKRITLGQSQTMNAFEQLIKESSSFIQQKKDEFQKISQSIFDKMNSCQKKRELIKVESNRKEANLLNQETQKVVKQEQNLKELKDHLENEKKKKKREKGEGDQHCEAGTEK